VEGKDLIVALEEKSKWIEKLVNYRDYLLVELQQKEKLSEELEKFRDDFINSSDYRLLVYLRTSRFTSWLIQFGKDYKFTSLDLEFHWPLQSNKPGTSYRNRKGANLFNHRMFPLFFLHKLN